MMSTDCAMNSLLSCRPGRTMTSMGSLPSFGHVVNGRFVALGLREELKGVGEMLDEVEEARDFLVAVVLEYDVGPALLKRGANSGEGGLAVAFDLLVGGYEVGEEVLDARWRGHDFLGGGRTRGRQPDEHMGTRA